VYLRRAALLVFMIASNASATPLPPGYSTVGTPTEDPDCPDYSSVSPGFYGGDGSTENEAIESVGIEFSVYRWIAENYPDATVKMQELVISPTTNLEFDVMHVSLADGGERNIWFWVSGGLDCLMSGDATSLDPQGMLAWVDIPRSVDVGDTVKLKITVENARNAKDFSLESVDLDGSFLRGFQLLSITPRPEETDEYSDMLELSYPMKIAAGDSVEFVLELEAIKVGVYIGEVSIWDEDDFLSRYVQSKVVE